MLTKFQHDVTNVTKSGPEVFSFDFSGHTHKFEASSSKERDAWVVAVEKGVEEAKGMKEDVTGRESYKKSIEEYGMFIMTLQSTPHDRR